MRGGKLWGDERREAMWRGDEGREAMWKGDERESMGRAEEERGFQNYQFFMEKAMM